MSFSADKVPILKAGAGHGQRRFSSSKEPSGNGMYELVGVRDGLEALGELESKYKRRTTWAKRLLEMEEIQHCASAASACSYVWIFWLDYPINFKERL
jgi:hypothetical protein